MLRDRLGGGGDAAEANGADSSEGGEVVELDAIVAPHCLDTEGIVLSHALEHGPVDGLLPKHFYAHCNQRVYEAIRMLQVRGEPVDIIAVKRALQADGRLAQVGGVTYLAMLRDTQPAASEPALRAHVEAIREFYRRRVLSDAALRLRVELRTGAASSAEAWVRFKTICDEMRDA